MTKEEFFRIFKKEAKLDNETVLNAYWKNFSVNNLDADSLRKQLRRVDSINKFLIKLFRATKI